MSVEIYAAFGTATPEEIYKKWDAHGILVELEREHAFNLAQLYEELAIILMNEATTSDNDITTIGFPILYRVFNNIGFDKNIDVKDLVREINKSYPLIKDTHTSYHDIEVEFASLFADNYSLKFEKYFTKITSYNI